ncbi:MAG TPA: hypothetical protein VFL92_02600 [Sphingomonas sp.]|nr:hypothetical protein [Sphingomonas sp.]
MNRRALLPLFALAPLLLAGCHRASQGNGAGEADAGLVHIPCALGGSPIFRTSCTVERKATGDGLMLVIHHPDGGFRRLLVTTDGRGVVTADGADEAQVSVVDPGTIEVAVGDDRYRLPATVKGGPLPRR